MAPKTICFGFDGICADMSFYISDLPKHQWLRHCHLQRQGNLHDLGRWGQSIRE
jgi:hypothetical protein